MIDLVSLLVSSLLVLFVAVRAVQLEAESALVEDRPNAAGEADDKKAWTRQDEPRSPSTRES